MDRANVQYWESLLKLIKYVVQTRNKTLVLMSKMNEDNLVNIEGFGDSKYGGNINTQKAVPGFIIYLTGAPISPRSKMQHSMTLLWTEAEYIVMSEVCAEMIFIKQIFEFIAFVNQVTNSG